VTEKSPIRTVALVLGLIALVVGLSAISNNLWGGRSETIGGQLKVDLDMTVAQFGQANNLPNPVLKELFGLQSRADLEKRLREFGLSLEELTARLEKKQALAAEQASKNWVKIPVKFGLWFIFLGLVYWRLKKGRVSPWLRKWLLFSSLAVFGIIMGSDPSPMGTVKDAIHLYGAKGAVFLPRMIALAVFLTIVFLANKYICAWGCQAGTLQDLIFRLNRTDRARAILGRQYKPAFVLTNSVRVAFLALFSLAAFAWGLDLIEPIDPFKIYKPLALTWLGGGFIALLLGASLFIYRPWCHFFCPFGLVGWLVEKVSRVRISVNYETCIACQKCAAACPSTVMGAILRRDRKTIPDCFACYTCRDACPTGSISFSTAGRSLPPPGHFDKKARAREAGPADQPAAQERP